MASYQPDIRLADGKRRKCSLAYTIGVNGIINTIDHRSGYCFLLFAPVVSETVFFMRRVHHIAVCAVV